MLPGALLLQIYHVSFPRISYKKPQEADNDLADNLSVSEPKSTFYYPLTPSHRVFSGLDHDL